jgi:hypothetical protein
MLIYRDKELPREKKESAIGHAGCCHGLLALVGARVVGPSAPMGHSLVSMVRFCCVIRRG